VFEVADFQIGAAGAETYISGSSAQSTCYACHKGTMNGKSYQAHIFPGFSPFGNYALDALPIANCKMCHNQDGYSRNPLVRKVHAAHRGEHLTNAGVAHPDYGLDADTTATAFTNVGFPSMPGMELDCAACHTGIEWKDRPARLACGTCHDNVFFDTGTLNPPRVLAKPANGSCTADADCTAVGALATCNTTTGFCQRANHPVQTDDAQCATCHPADGTATPTTMPVAAAHEIIQRTRTRGIKLTSVTIAGGSGPNGTFMVGDVPTMTFKLADKNDAVIADLKTNAALSANMLAAGPTDDMQRIYGPTGTINMKTAALTFDGASGTYAYVFPNAIPAAPLAPLNAAAALRTSNPAGTYTVWIYVNEAITVGTQSTRDAANALVSFKLGADQPVRPRQVIAQAACDSCHVRVQAHGGGRQAAEGCNICHTRGATDRTIGGLGNPCSATVACPGAAAGWETCRDTNNDGTLDTCVITSDPTPNQSIDFSKMIHQIHFARRLEGYSERGNLISPGKLNIIGFRNGANDFSEILLPMDIRNCTKCHADTAATCNASTPCGVGQSCAAGQCRNVAWKDPSARVCLSCHDSSDAFGHAALQTYTDPTSGEQIETCNVCHGDGADFSIEKVHSITTPYVPPYPRE
jgi:hypothetical protein